MAAKRPLQAPVWSASQAAHDTEVRRVAARQVAVWQHRVGPICAACLVCLSLWCIAILSPLNAQLPASRGDEELVESFAGPRTSWRVVEQDCRLAVGRHERIREQGESERTYELMTFEAGHGTRILLQHDLRPVVVIPELIPSVWIRANQARLRLHALVVLPRSDSPDGRGPVQFLIDGPEYVDVGRWQKLSFADAEADLATLVRRKAQLYRRGLSEPIDEQGAYVAGLVLNAYGGPGSTWLQLDDLTLEGHVPWDASLIGGEMDAAEQLRNPQSHATEAHPLAENPIRHASGKLQVEGAPFFARVIRHQGESLYDLKKLGFNVVLLDHPPTPVLAEEAATNDLWLICPPHVEPLQNGRALYRRVLAWNLGRHLIMDDLPRIRQQALSLTNRADLPARPTYVHTHHGVSRFGTVVDIVEIGRPVLGTCDAAEDYFSWLRSRINSAPQRATVWCTLPTTYPQALQEQARLLAQESLRAATLSPPDLERLAWEGLAAGARGLVFASDERLDELDPDTKDRARLLRWLNESLQPMGPWVAAGTLLGRERTSQPGVIADTLSTPRADLILVRRPPTTELTPGASPGPVTLYVDRASLVSSAFALTSLGAEPLRHERRGGGLRVRLESLQQLQAVVVTQDPKALQHLQQHGAPVALPRLTLQADCLANWRTELEQIVQELATEGTRLPSHQQRSREAGETISQARRFLLAGDPRSAEPLLQSAQADLERTQQALMQTIRAPFANRMASPLLQAIEWLPAHVRLGQELRAARWSLNTLPAGEFGDLEHVRASGWQNHRGQDPRLTPEVDLAIDPADTTNRYLRLRVRLADQVPPETLWETTPLWIVTPPLRVEAGELVRIHGRVRFVETEPRQTSALMILESIGGLALAERFTASSDWREFTLYRVVPQNGDLRVTFAMTGPGEAHLDDVQVQRASLPTAEQLGVRPGSSLAVPRR